MKDLRDYKKSVFSQFGQDGVIEEVFREIGTGNKFFVEFGSSGTDSGGGNTPYLRRLGFDGLLMDGDADPYGVKTKKQYDVKQEFVTVENVLNLFDKYGVPHEFDFLSIDIDGNDFWVWKEILSCHIPRVVCIEANYYVPPGMSIVQKYVPDFKWNGDCRFGASFEALKKLGKENDYDLVSICGCDMIFVKECEEVEELDDIEIEHDLELVDIEKAHESIRSWDGWISY